MRKAKRHAKEAGMEFNLTKENIRIPTHCPILGIPIIFGLNKCCDNSPSIDRFDSSKGYIPDNVNVISWRANRLKNNGNLSEFEKLVSWLKENG